MSGNLYQLKTSSPVQVGSYVVIDGPHDRYGKVLALRESGYHLIRGTVPPPNVEVFINTTGK